MVFQGGLVEMPWSWSGEGGMVCRGLGQSTVIDFEKERRIVSAQAIGAIQVALEAHGIELIHENGGGVGVRLRKKG